MKYEEIDYKKPPLPFQGNKRYWLRDVTRLLKDCRAHTYVDLFGGSGILSHTIKRIHPAAHVIWNDYRGDYGRRLGMIDKTNQIIRDIETIKASHDLAPLKRFPPQLENEIRAYLEDLDDYDAETVASRLCFSSGQVKTHRELIRAPYYMKTGMAKEYDLTGYLEGVIRVDLDWRCLYTAYSGDPGVCYVADPPYLTTYQDRYAAYADLSGSLQTLCIMKEDNFLYFSSEKSQLEAVLNWFRNAAGKDFTHYEKMRRNTYLAQTSRCKAVNPEILWYRFKKQ